MKIEKIYFQDIREFRNIQPIYLFFIKLLNDTHRERWLYIQSQEMEIYGLNILRIFPKIQTGTQSSVLSGFFFVVHDIS